MEVIVKDLKQLGFLLTRGCDRFTWSSASNDNPWTLSEWFKVNNIDGNHLICLDCTGHDILKLEENGNKDKR